MNLASIETLKGTEHEGAMFVIFPEMFLFVRGTITCDATIQVRFTERAWCHTSSPEMVRRFNHALQVLGHANKIPGGYCAKDDESYEHLQDTQLFPGRYDGDHDRLSSIKTIRLFKQ